MCNVENHAAENFAISYMYETTLLWVNYGLTDLDCFNKCRSTFSSDENALSTRERRNIKANVTSDAET
jgi:hypothetical protein